MLFFFLRKLVLTEFDLNNVTGTIVVMTGTTDYISDGEWVLKVSNGHPLASHLLFEYNVKTLG